MLSVLLSFAGQQDFISLNPSNKFWAQSEFEISLESALQQVGDKVYVWNRGTGWQVAPKTERFDDRYEEGERKEVSFSVRGLTEGSDLRAYPLCGGMILGGGTTSFAHVKPSGLKFALGYDEWKSVGSFDPVRGGTGSLRSARLLQIVYKEFLESPYPADMKSMNEYVEHRQTLRGSMMRISTGQYFFSSRPWWDLEIGGANWDQAKTDKRAVAFKADGKREELSGYWSTDGRKGVEMWRMYDNPSDIQLIEIQERPVYQVRLSGFDWTIRNR